MEKWGDRKGRGVTYNTYESRQKKQEKAAYWPSLKTIRQQIKPRSCPEDVKKGLYTLLCFLSYWQQHRNLRPGSSSGVALPSTQSHRNRKRIVQRSWELHSCSPPSFPPKGETRWGFANRWTLQMKCWRMAVNMQKISTSAACYGESRVTPSTARTNV